MSPIVNAQHFRQLRLYDLLCLSQAIKLHEKLVDRTKHTVSINVTFPIFRGILSTSTSPIAVLVLSCFCLMAFYAVGLRVCTSGSSLPRRLEKGYLDIEKHAISR